MQQALKVDEIIADMEKTARKMFKLGLLSGLAIATVVFGVAVYLSAVIYV